VCQPRRSAPATAVINCPHRHKNDVFFKADGDRIGFGEVSGRILPAHAVEATASNELLGSGLAR
jgi:hypothetical protein